MLPPGPFGTAPEDGRYSIPVRDISPTPLLADNGAFALSKLIRVCPRGRKRHRHIPEEFPTDEGTIVNTTSYGCGLPQAKQPSAERTGLEARPSSPWGDR